eukprot:CAMPEP_0195511892 /NCGR_PEP_ID=MMETSP0794_2-20130614/4049_1 /TAXON_ID=515487 /ORGANISM="Stephanopyxis turris, Strain CCMP 815" /LENGTH=144 /DNA_ID=CAMNT_0040639567 /DNA_START=176 /DNA_END=610 /DNA_ORIENTATION=+
MGTIISHCREAVSSPDPWTKTSKFLFAQGLTYLSMGGLLFASPRTFGSLVFIEDSQMTNIEAWRLLGMEVGIVGYFYATNARSKHFAKTSVLDRILPVPLLLVGQAQLGTPKVLCYLFAVVEPLLGVLTSLSLTSEENTESKKD